MRKNPPLEKVAEALSAVADSRVRMHEDYALVASSNRSKEYTVRWKDDEYTSNDSATYWQQYAGYPVIAVLLLQGRLAFDRDLATQFAGINWTELNKKHKRNYAAALAEVLQSIEARGGDTGSLTAEMSAIYTALTALPITIGRGAARPAKTKAANATG